MGHGRLWVDQGRPGPKRDSKDPKASGFQEYIAAAQCTLLAKHRQVRQRVSIFV